MKFKIKFQEEEAGQMRHRHQLDHHQRRMENNACVEYRQPPEQSEKRVQTKEKNFTVVLKTCQMVPDVIFSNGLIDLGVNIFQVLILVVICMLRVLIKKDHFIRTDYSFHTAVLCLLFLLQAGWFLLIAFAFWPTLLHITLPFS